MHCEFHEISLDIRKKGIDKLAALAGLDKFTTPEEILAN